MATGTALTGLGVAPALADALGFEPSSLTATGSNSQANGATIKSTMVRLTTAGGADSAVLPSNATVGTPYFVSTISATSGIVFCPSGATLNGTSNGSLTIAQNKTAIFIQNSRNVWVSILTA